MHNFGFVLGTCASLASGSVMAADLGLYPSSPPPSGSPVYASHSMVTGDASIAIGYFEFEGFDTGEVWGTTRVNIPFAGGAINQEFELNGLDGFAEDSYYTYGIYGHTYAKSSGGALGLLLGASNLAGGHALTLGAEGAVFLPSATLAGLLAYSWGSDGQSDFWSAFGEARWYWSPDTKLTGSVAFNEFNTAWKWTAGAEHRFAGAMVSLFGEGTYYNNTFGNGWEFFAGGRVFFDQPGQTLQDHDHDVPFAAARAITY